METSGTASKVTILDALDDAELFGSQFGGNSWGAWPAFLAALFGATARG